MNRKPLAHILLHYGAGDSAFLCDEVTVLSPWEPRRIAAEIVKEETR